MFATSPRQRGFVLLLFTFLLVYRPAFCADGESPFAEGTLYLQRYEPEGESLMVTVNIWGQVVSPGKYKVPDGTDIVALISYAGGPTEYASLSDIRLSRPSADGGSNVEFDAERYLANPVPGSAPLLKPGDTVYVLKNRKYAWKAFVEVVAQVAVITSTVLLVYTVVKEEG